MSALGSRLVAVTRTGQAPAFFAAMACAVTLFAFLRMPDYRVDTVIVRGARIGDPAEVARASGALERSIFRVDPDEAAAGVATLPWVARASVRLERPDRLVVEVVEREPAAVWSDGERTALVDTQGQMLLLGDAPELPHVVDPAANLVPGGAVTAADVAAVVALTAALGDNLQRLEWADPLGLQATLADGRVLVFGDGERMELKLAALTAFLATPPAVWSLADFSEPERPYFR